MAGKMNGVGQNRYTNNINEIKNQSSSNRRKGSNFRGPGFVGDGKSNGSN